MKKLMFAMAVAACAAAVQASTLTYGATSGSIDSSTCAYGDMYVLWANTGTSIDWSSLSGKASYTIDDVTGLGLSRVEHLTGAFSKEVIDPFTFSDPGAQTKRQEAVTPWCVGETWGDTKHKVDLYVVMVAGDGQNVAYSDAMNREIGAIGNTENIDVISSSFNYAAVPEPTSGLLLLLGVAGLALKRKRA